MSGVTKHMSLYQKSPNKEDRIMGSGNISDTLQEIYRMADTLKKTNVIGLKNL